MELRLGEDALQGPSDARFVILRKGKKNYVRLELEPLEDGTFLADFNLAYNPYCAYSEDYNCLVPPAENRIGVPVRAGEMQYQGH